MNRLLPNSILIFSIIAIGGCAQGSADSDSSASDHSSSQSSVLSRLRPKANPNIVRAVQEEERRKQEEQMAQAAMQGQDQSDSGNLFSRTFGGVGSMLPRVSTEPISTPSAESIASSAPTLNPFGDSAQETTNSRTIDSTTLAPAEDINPVSDVPADQVATYSLHYNPAGMAVAPPGAMGMPGSAPMSGIVPPPPAVTLSTDARVGFPPPPPNAMPYNPYANPYANPYMNPYQVPAPYQPPVQQAPPEEPKRPAGLFGPGSSQSNSGSSSRDAEAEARKREEEDNSDFVPIRPTGMPARSPYKQKDDLKILWDGALGTYAFHEVLAEDDKLEGVLRRVSVGMPPDSSKGMFSVPARQVVTIFRPMRLNKKVTDRVSKMQNDLVQCYYRYLHTYNKYVLAQQTVAARKQEIEVARSRAEKQRAAADLAASQNEADSTKEDMKAAQYELAAIAGAKSARSVIGRVSGVTPSVGALAQAEKSTQPVEMEPGESGSGKGVFGSVGNFLFGNKGDSDKQDEPKKVAKKAKSQDTGSGLSLFGKKGRDLAPSPEKKSTPKVVAKPSVSTESKATTPKVAASPISFELKNVNITARKSILSVAIKNSGSKDFKVSSDHISMLEGNRKVSSETMRAKFDAGLVRPNQEVQGKITIYGRPWNDRLAVYISDGSSNIQLKRR